jgi:hypothetical protein
VTNEKRFERALKRIATMRPEENEWDAVDRFAEAQKIAQHALDPELGPRLHTERQQEWKRLKALSRQFRKYGSAGIDCYWHRDAEQWARVRVLNHGCSQPDVLEIKILEPHGAGTYTNGMRIGDRHTVNIGSLFLTKVEMDAKFPPPWPDITIKSMYPSLARFGMHQRMFEELERDARQVYRTLPRDADIEGVTSSVSGWAVAWLNKRGYLCRVSAKADANRRIVIDIRPENLTELAVIKELL